MQVQMLKIETLASYSKNPPARTKEGKKLASLQESIEKFGIVQPLTVTSDGTVIDGNRRLACAKALKIKEIPCLVRRFKKKKEQDELFESINTSVMKITSQQEVYIYEAGGVISRRTLNDIEFIKKMGGVRFYNANIVKKEGSPYAYARLIRLYKRHTQANDKTSIRRLLRWAATIQGAHSARLAIEDGIPVDMLHKAIKSKTPLKKGWN